MVTKSGRINDVQVRTFDTPHQVVTNLGKPRDDHQFPHFYTECEGRQLPGEDVFSLAGAASLQCLFAHESEIIIGYFAEVNPDNPVR